MSPKLLLLLAFFPAYQAWDLSQIHLSGGFNYHLVAEAIATLVFVCILYLFVRERERAARDLAELRNAARARDGRT
jgi:hypothetical protein